ncbi:hypothetical protein P5633_22185 [Bacillus subtilis]|uniref:Uncharacterized protein n=1 Tax=Bacillus subtilis TaxID=1423 RepID=A0AC62A4D2_BACIU
MLTSSKEQAFIGSSYFPPVEVVKSIGPIAIQKPLLSWALPKPTAEQCTFYLKNILPLVDVLNDMMEKNSLEKFGELKIIH